MEWDFADVRRTVEFVSFVCAMLSNEWAPLARGEHCELRHASEFFTGCLVTVCCVSQCLVLCWD